MPMTTGSATIRSVPLQMPSLESVKIGSFPDIEIQRADSKQSIATIHVIDDSDGETVEREEPKPDPLANLRASLNSFRDASASPNNVHFEMQSPPKMIESKQTRSKRTNEEPVGIQKKDECHFCGVKILNTRRLLKHLGRCRSLTVQCPVGGCRRRFGWQCELKEHHRRKHSGERPFKCSECDGQFFSRGNLRQHRHRMHPRIDHKDPEHTEQRGEDEQDGDVLMVSVKKESTEIVAEDDDDEMLDDELEMEIVRLLVAIKNGDYRAGPLRKEEPLRIAELGQSQNRRGRGPEEVNTTASDQCVDPEATNKKWCRCPFCPRKYKRRGNLNRHIEQFHDDPGHKYECDLCGEEFDRHCDLSIHHQTHSAEKTHSCDRCSYSTHWSYNLNRHKMSHHRLD